MNILKKCNYNNTEGIIMEALVQYGVNNNVGESVCCDEEYQSLQQEMASFLDEIKRMDLSEQQMFLVNRLLSSYNDSSVHYGNICYRQGLLDGVELMKKIGLVWEESSQKRRWL